ncbi:MAG: EAL domain-containing protein [Rubrobacteraceae bacterium]
MVKFLGWLTFAVLVFAALQILAFVVFQDLGAGISGAALFAYGLLLLVGRNRVGRGEREIAVAITCFGFLVAALVVVVAQPTLVSVLILAPLLAVGVALPYAGDRFLRRLMVASWFVTFAIALVGEFPSPASALPSWYQSSFSVAAIVTASTVVLLLLWQFRTRLAGTLAQARAAEKQMRHDAYHDALTGLPNRALFMERVVRTMERARKDENYLFAVLFLDLDRFKNVNDSLGHSVGDLLLVEIAQRLRSCVHPTDTVARLGGDEFTVLLENLEEPENATEVAERLQEELEVPIKVGRHELYTTVSVGIVANVNHRERPEELLRDADMAMYQAKENGRARYEIFETEMLSRVTSILNLEIDLRGAVQRGEFAAFYQPIVSLRSGEVTGFEALLRWKHPEQGLLKPAKFVSLAEEIGLIGAIGGFMIREACGEIAALRRKFPDHQPLAVSVNLSAAQLVQPGFVEELRRVLREIGLNGHGLHLEITESAVMRDVEQAARAILELRELGVKVHLDDFGTGYSSLSLLHRLAVDSLKIDKSFVNLTETGDDKAEIVQAITTLAHSLGMDAVAEGVETSGQLALLRSIGCDYGQGFYFSKAVDARGAEEILAARPRW